MSIQLIYINEYTQEVNLPNLLYLLYFFTISPAVPWLNRNNRGIRFTEKVDLFSNMVTTENTYINVNLPYIFSYI